MEYTRLQKKIAKTYEDMARTLKVYPSYPKVAAKVGVSPKYAFYVLKQYKKEKSAFGLKNYE
jgi:hypothetical protein